MSEKKGGFASDWAIILLALLIASISVFLIVFSGIMYNRWLNKEVPQQYKSQNTYESTRDLSGINYDMLSPEELKASDGDTVFVIHSEDELNAYINNSSNVGTVIQMNAWVFSTKDEIEQDNEMWLNWLSDDLKTVGTHVYITGTKPSGIGLDVGNMIQYTGEFTGEWKEYHSDLFGTTSKHPIFNTINVSMIGDNNSSAEDNETTDPYSAVITTADDYREYASEPGNVGAAVAIKGTVTEAAEYLEIDDILYSICVEYGTDNQQMFLAMKNDENYDIKVGDVVVFTGELTGAVNQNMPSMRVFKTINITVVD